MIKREILKKMAAAYILSGIMAASLTACSAKETKNTNTLGNEKIEEVSNQTKKKDTETKEKTVDNFQAEYYDFKTDLEYMSDFCYDNDRVYMVGYKSSEEGATIWCFLSCKTDGSDIQESDILLEENEYYSGGFCIDKEGKIRFITNSYSEKDGNRFFVKTLNKEGKDLESYQISVKEEDGCYFSRPLITKDGKIYDTGNGKICSFDKEGKKINIIEVDNSLSVQQLVEIEDGSIYAYCQKDFDGSFRKVDTETGKLGEAIAVQDGLGSRIRNVIAGKGNKIYIDTGINLYSFDLSNSTLKTVLNWINSGINLECLRDYTIIGEDSFFAVSYPMGTEDGQHQAVIIKKAENAKEKTVLTLVCAYMRGDMKENILKFNRENEDYQIEIQDYEDYEDYEVKLNMDIIAGKVPDILCMNSLPQDVYVKKGILADLYPFMEKDADIKKEDFLEPVLEVLEKDGKLYCMGGSFSFEGLFVGGKKNLGEKTGLSIEDMQALYDKVPKQGLFMQGMTKEWFLLEAVTYKMGDFVDWSQGKVSFDSENFLQILEFTNNFPKQEEREQYYSAYDYEKMGKILKKGNLMLDSVVISEWSDFNEYDTLFQAAGGMSVLSYPSVDKSDKLLISFHDPGMAITESCSNKEGAWEFIKTILSYDYQVELYHDGFLNYGFPTRKDALEKQLEYAMATEEYTDTNGKVIKPLSVGTNYYGINIEGKPLKEKHKKLLEEMINRIGGFIERSNPVIKNICDIVDEEAKAFFAGDKTKEETAEIIQNRVKLYISENS